MSEADVHIKALFKKHLGKHVDIVVVNIKDLNELRQTYAALSRNVSFLKCSFEEMVNDDRLMDRLLS